MADARVRVERKPTALGVSRPVRLRVTQGRAQQSFRVPEGGTAEFVVRDDVPATLVFGHGSASPWRGMLRDGDHMSAGRAPMDHYLRTGNEAVLVRRAETGVGIQPARPPSMRLSALTVIATILALAAALLTLADLVRTGESVGLRTGVPLALGIAALAAAWIRQGRINGSEVAAASVDREGGQPTRALWVTPWPWQVGLAAALLVGITAPGIVDEPLSRLAQAASIAVLIGVPFAVLATVLQRRALVRAHDGVSGRA